MNKVIKYILLGLVVAIVVIQFVGPARPEVRTDSPDDLLQNAEVTGEVTEIIRGACYDCHSMETKYPWYASIAPVSWWLYHHIEEGREELNFSEWASMSKRDKLKALNDFKEELEEGEMPLSSYVNMHPEADLSPEQKQLILAWADQLGDQVLAE